MLFDVERGVAVDKEDGRLVVGDMDDNGVAIGKVECRVVSASGMKVICMD